MVTYSFTGRTPTSGQVEKLRLILSTYQDGTGQLVYEPNTSLPGWRDFERSVALAFDGVAQESKAIFDVLVPLPARTVIYIMASLAKCVRHYKQLKGQVE